MAENFPNMERNLNIQFHEPHRVALKFHSKMFFPRRLFKPKIITFKAAR